MPTLLDVQRAVRDRLTGNGQAVHAMLAEGVSGDRLDIYRNTVCSTLARALRLCYPAVCKLVGQDFFDGAAAAFASDTLPNAAWLDRYGGGFADFLARFEPVRSLPYLPDVARLEWAVNEALHAPQAESLDLLAFAQAAARDASRIILIPHPSVRWLRLDSPADVIWRAVLEDDAQALERIDLDQGPLRVVVESIAGMFGMHRLAEADWQFASRLGGGEKLQTVIASLPDFDASAALAQHLAIGRFIGWSNDPSSPCASETWELER
jgi:hypothetical protein